MLKNIWQLTTIILIMSFLVLLQFSFISALPNPFRQFNLVLVVLIFILFFLGLKVSLWSALVAGFWMDIFSFNFFGFFMLLFLVVILLAQWILKDWLTNRSLYSLLALMISMTFFYNLSAYTILYLVGSNFNNFFLWQSHFWVTLAYQSLWALVASVILFNLAALLSRRIKPFFLEKKTFV